MTNSINICRKAAEASTDFENSNTELKQQYLIRSVELYNSIIAKVDGNRGSFGTGYPFYALAKNPINGKPLPIIEEQIRYNNELIDTIENSQYTSWPCYDCLLEKSSTMPDLKSICKPCPHVDKALKPRKIINRLPDIDMWMVCKDTYIDTVKDELLTLFSEYNLYPSDINPIQTINDMVKISQDLKNGIMPEKTVPLDAHIIGYSTLSSLIEQVPAVLKQASEEHKVPYLPIRPLSYRKVWQYDDEAYNFIYDYLSAFTEFNFEDGLQQLLTETRSIVANNYSVEQLYDFLIASAQESNQRRFKALELKKIFGERIESWKK